MRNLKLVVIHYLGKLSRRGAIPFYKYDIVGARITILIFDVSLHDVFPLSLALSRHPHADLEWSAFSKALLDFRFRLLLAVGIIGKLATSLRISNITQPILSAEAVVRILILPVLKLISYLNETLCELQVLSLLFRLHTLSG